MPPDPADVDHPFLLDNDTGDLSTLCESTSAIWQANWSAALTFQRVEALTL